MKNECANIRGGVEIPEQFVITKELVFDQMVDYRCELMKLRAKEKRLRHGIEKAEAVRRLYICKPVGDIETNKFFRRLKGMYDRLSEIPTKRREAEERIATLRFSENWN